MFGDREDEVRSRQKSSLQPESLIGMFENWHNESEHGWIGFVLFQGHRWGRCQEEVGIAFVAWHESQSVQPATQTGTARERSPGTCTARDRSWISEHSLWGLECHISSRLFDARGSERKAGDDVRVAPGLCRRYTLSKSNDSIGSLACGSGTAAPNPPRQAGRCTKPTKHRAGHKQHSRYSDRPDLILQNLFPGCGAWRLTHRPWRRSEPCPASTGACLVVRLPLRCR